MLREKNDRLKVYEFLYNRLPFTEDEKSELERLQKIDILESKFNQHLAKISSANLDVIWHCDINIKSTVHHINIMLATDYCYYLFILHDFIGKHYINTFNILCNEDNEPIYDFNQSNEIFDHFKQLLIDEGKYQRPIIIKHVMMDDSFFVHGNRKDLILKNDDLPYYLKAIESAAKVRKKYQRPL